MNPYKKEYINPIILDLVKPLGIEILSDSHAFMKYAQTMPLNVAGSYNPKRDFIAINENCIIPNTSQFDPVNSSNSTFLHELTHWTGGKGRCNRIVLTSMQENGNSIGLSRKEMITEEFIANYGSLVLLDLLGLKTIEAERSILYYSIFNNLFSQNDRLEIIQEVTKAIEFLQNTLQIKFKKVA